MFRCQMGLALLIALLVGLAACDQPSARVTTAPKATATRLPGLPVFSDWRVGYLDSENHVHAVSVDGKHDVSDTSTLQGLTHSAIHAGSAVFSPDGTFLAYPSDGFETFGFAVVDETGAYAPMYVPAGQFTLHWSFDGSQLAAGDGDGVQILAVADNTLTAVPVSSSFLISEVLGWTDTSHLVVIASAPTRVPTPAPTITEVPSGPAPGGPDFTTTLYVLDVASGALHPFVTVGSKTSGTPDFALSPDGQTVFYDDRPFRDEPFTPDVALIDVKTGAMTHLPHIASTTQAWFSSVAFLPGTHTVAVSQGDYLTGAFQTWLLDTSQDTLTPLAANHGVAVGWVPGTRTLILTTGTVASEHIGQGPYVISAVPDPLANPQANAITLTTLAFTFTWLGFVKTT